MSKYKYTGQIKVAVLGLGTLTPGQVVEVDKDTVINHPHFELVVDEQKPVSTKKK